MSSEEYTKFLCYQEALKHSSTLISVVANSGNPNTCLVSSSSKWVIDSGANHMTGNPSLFPSFHTPLHTSSVTLADGSTSPVLGTGTIIPTPTLPLSPVLSFPNFAFNLISISKITRNLNCSVTFFPGYCVFQDLVTNRVIGKGYESAVLYLLDTSLPKSISCLGVGTVLEAHYRLGHPSLPLLKKLHPQFNKMLIGLDLKMIEDPQLAIASLLVVISSLGKVRSRMWFLVRVLNQNIGLWHNRHVRLIWINHLLSEIGLKTPMPAKLWCDNQATIHIANNPVFHERTKHIEVDCHCVREKIQQGLISTGHVKMGEQLGDLFTKALNGIRVGYLCNKLGMINIYAPT
ncbi:unnamed protein product [Cuscuta epithymum]|uniref:Retrovirus-related Pol polyprotein from transposon TNT 1-94-like beta-barrel domain-containing protein n=1 Tax=Cuscuta epithymum TaxID=186058 RepID=A0AAV0D045_9ASTE|nr:unnamed protein product [Cuscuta epithymum]